MVKDIIKYHWLLILMSGLAIWTVWSTYNSLRIAELEKELEKVAVDMTDESYDEIKRYLSAGVDVNYEIVSMGTCWCTVGGSYSCAEYKVSTEKSNNGIGTSSLLMIAVDRGCEKIVRMLVDEGASLECECNGYTALHIAAQNGDIELVKYFLSLGCDVDGEGYATPLLLAAEYGHKEIVDLLIGNGANVNSVDPESCSPLYYASLNGHIGIIKTLIDKGADVNIQNKHGLGTAILSAIYKGQIEAAKLLLDAGADIYLSHKFSIDPLYAAIRSGKPEMVELVLSYDPDLDAVYDNGVSCMKSAIWSENGEILRMIVEAKGLDLDTEFWKAVEKGRGDWVEQYIAAGADVNSIHKVTGDTPLIFSMGLENGGAMRALLEAGADVNVKRKKDGLTALEIAIKKHMSFEEILIAGAEIPEELYEKYEKWKDKDRYDKYIFELLDKYIDKGTEGKIVF